MKAVPYRSIQRPRPWQGHGLEAELFLRLIDLRIRNAKVEGHLGVRERFELQTVGSVALYLAQQEIPTRQVGISKRQVLRGVRPAPYRSWSYVIRVCVSVHGRSG